jgi:hypothetical protein
LPTQAYAADAVAAEKANITVAVTAAKTYFIFTPSIECNGRDPPKFLIWEGIGRAADHDC